MKTPVYYSERQRSSPFCPTLLPTLAVSSLFEEAWKASLRRSICPQIVCGYLPTLIDLKPVAFFCLALKLPFVVNKNMLVNQGSVISFLRQILACFPLSFYLLRSPWNPRYHPKKKNSINFKTLFSAHTPSSQVAQKKLSWKEGKSKY